MRRTTLVGLFVIICAVFFMDYAGESFAENSVSGSVTVNKAKIQFRHAYIDEGNPNSPIVVLTDKPLSFKSSEGVLGLLADEFIRKNKIHVLIFEINPATKKLEMDGGLCALYFPGKKTHYFALDKTMLALTVGKLDGSLIEGKISTPKPIADDFYEITVSVQASFKVSRKASK